MKWFKHQTDTDRDEKIARLEDMAGLEGYGFFWRVLEIIAQKMDWNDKCHLTYDAKTWARRCGISTKKFLFLLKCCASVGLVLVQLSDDNVMISAPNLLKYREHHTKNLKAKNKKEVAEDEGVKNNA